MSLSGFVRGGISVLMGILSLYILENTYGIAMDSMYLTFTGLLTKLSLGPGWANVATGVLGGWVWFDRAFVICVIALFVWLVSLIFVDVDYGKQAPPGQYR
jgi:hypothetical protein